MKGTSSPREDLAEDAWLEKTHCLVEVYSGDAWGRAPSLREDMAGEDPA